MSTQLKSEPFNPNDLAVGGGVYGLPFNVNTATQVIIPVPMGSDSFLSAGYGVGS